MEQKTFFDRLTERVNIDEENYVILQSPTYGELQNVMQQAMKVSMHSGEEPSAEVDIFEMEILSILACIKDWGGPGFAGRKPTRQSILELPQSVIEVFKPVVDRLTSKKKDEKKILEGSMN